MNFRQSLEDPGNTLVVDEEDVIFDAQEFNGRIVASVRVAGTQSNNIEVSNIYKQRRVVELVTNERISEMIHNEKQHKDVKYLNPVQMAELAVENCILEEPAFVWWVKYVLKKRDRIISKTQRFWVKTHKYGIRVSNTVNEAIDVDKENVDTLCWDAIMKEMKILRSAFGVWDKRNEDLPIGYQEIKCRMIFDIKLGENFCRKSRLVGGAHKTATPA